jgi:polysaccharide deacetylase family protein (PEP-CTERM system associated)
MQIVRNSRTERVAEAVLAQHNILTVDVEEWFHILEVEGGYTRDDWASLESRVEANTDTLLELFATTGTTGTFFVVGWVAWKHPELVRRIAAAGHEIASHSFWHEVVTRHSRASLAADLAASKKLLEDLSGRPVLGFRAPGGSITHDTAWAFDVIAEAGFSYDASVNPGHSSHGGFATPYFGPHRIRCRSGELAEIPWTTVGVAGRRLPFAGGGYLRLFPYRLIRSCVAAENRQGRPATVYVHPREIDPDQPRMELPWRRRFKYYVGLQSTAPKLRSLLHEHRFTSARAWLDANEASLAEQVFDVRNFTAREAAPVASAPPPPPALC